MWILLVYLAYFLMAALVVAWARYRYPNPNPTHHSRPFLRAFLFLLGALITGIIMTLVGFAGVGKRLS